MQYELSGAKKEDSDYESGYVTVIRKTPDFPTGKATALFNWKAIAMEVLNSHPPRVEKRYLGTNGQCQNLVPKAHIRTKATANMGLGNHTLALFLGTQRLPFYQSSIQDKAKCFHIESIFLVFQVTPEENVIMVMLMAIVTALVVQAWYEEETTDTRPKEKKKHTVQNSQADKKGIWGRQIHSSSFSLES